MNRNTPDNEARFAAEDPQYSMVDEDLLAWHDRHTEEVLAKFRHIVEDITESFLLDDQSILIRNADYLGEWLTEYLEEEL